VLTSDEWYEISREFLTDIADFIRDITRRAVPLPPALRAEDENTYLARVARGNLVSYHTKDFIVNGDQVELCDILSGGRQLVHVKRWESSKTFSHLLRQGAVSAETLLRIPAARKHLRDNAARNAQAINRSFPAANYRPDRLDLPFFTRLSLMREAEQIRNQGYGVAYQRIPIR
jgi:uncharacterized protein (TIGR04141 family)